LKQLNIEQFSTIVRIKNKLIKRNKIETDEIENQKNNNNISSKEKIFIDVIERIKGYEFNKKGEILEKSSIYYNNINMEIIEYVYLWVKNYAYNNNTRNVICDASTTKLCAS